MKKFKLRIAPVDLALPQDRLILGPRMDGALVILVFGFVFRKNVSMKQFKLRIAPVDLALLQDRLILAARMDGALVILVFGSFFLEKMF